ncbi:hypothetical protein MLD38_038156 [Melastoma candidum]|uniref:Uncharacterized protein n=1 Tax=Melastoma candidum TaxID=119954 RepID=A0ACB9KZ66_9MYRT|nr:hypothetical protein MLD38_038156 [Melastoma candidum]
MAGETKPLSGDGNSRFMTWWKGGSNKRSSSRRPLPVKSDDDEENDEDIDEQENDEARYYGLEDTNKPKLTAPQGPKTPAGPIREKDRPMDISQGARSKTKSCAGCKLDISQGTCREFNGVFFHPQCLCCRTCGRQIADHEPSLSEGGHPHHKSCCEASRHQTCDVCRQPLPMNRLGRPDYVNGRFWSQKYCQRHDFDNTPRCWCCIRLQPRDATYISFADGRILCPECKSSSVMFIEECRLLYHNVKGFLEEMNMCLDRPVFVHLVDKTALIQAMMQRGLLPTALDIGYAFPRTLDIIILLLYGSPSWDAGSLNY